MILIYGLTLTVYNLKMSTSEEPSLNSVSEEGTKHHLSNKVHNKFEEIVDDPIRQVDEQAQTPTPARPPVETGPPEPAVGNPQPGADSSDAKDLQGFKFTKKMMVILGVVLVLLLAGTITAIVLFMARRNQFEVVIETSVITNRLASSDANIETQRMSVKDTQTFNTNAPVTVYAKKVVRRGGRSGPTPNGARLLQEEQTYATFSFCDPATGVCVSVSSKDLQLRASIDFNTALEYVITNQPNPEYIEETPRSLQEATPSTPTEGATVTKNFTFYNINDQIASSVKAELVKLDQGVKVQQEVTHNIKYNSDTYSYEFTTKNPAPPTNDTAPLHDPTTTPVVTDLNNATQVASAITKVVSDILLKSQEFLLKRMADLEETSKVYLSQTDISNGTTSIYIDKPEDIGKLCANVNDGVITCDSRALASEAINLTPPRPGDNAEPSAALVVLIDV